MEHGKIRLLLAEDMHMVRGALAALLKLEPDFTLVSEVARGDEVVPAALHGRPHVAIVDIDLPGIDGLTAAQELRKALPTCRTLVLTSLGRPGMLRRALDAQVFGFLLKDAPPCDLAEGIRRVHAGQRAIDPTLAMAAWGTTEDPLTARESEVLRLLAEGAETPEIARELYLAVGTVRNYTTSIITKLNARNRIDAVRIARDTGWLA